MIKVSLILLSGLLATQMLRRRSAAFRHRILAAAILCASVVPLIEPLAPSVRVPLQPSWFGRTVEPLTLFIPVHATQAAEDLAAAPASSGFTRRALAARALGAVWFAGAAFGLLGLAVGIGRFWRIRARSTAMHDLRWAGMLDDLIQTYGIRRAIELSQSDRPSLPVTWGVWRPTILLPRTASEWSDERIRIVLGHELAHIQRHDWLMNLVAIVLRSIYWFNPLAWIAYRQLRLESEQACDDVVLALGVDGAEYATHLLDLARAFKQSRSAWIPAPAMARPSSLERRVRAMLNPQISRTPLSAAAGLAIAVTLAAVSVPLAGLAASAQSSTASFSGVLVDAVGRMLPNTTLVLTNAQTKEKHEVASDGTAHFAFAGLTAGDYLLEAKRLGFAAAQGRVSLDAGQHLTRDVALQVGDLHETMRVLGNPGVAPPAPAPRVARMTSQSSLDTCTPPATGGEIVPPLKLVHDQPVYPARERDAGVGATVELDARIGVDGLVKDFRLTAPAEQDFVDATIEAVRHWQFSQTRLDCVPVEVTMHVSTAFVIQ